MGERAKAALIIMVGYGAMLIGYTIYKAAISPPCHIAHWDGWSTFMATMTGLGFVGGLICTHLDYRADRKKWDWVTEERS